LSKDASMDIVLDSPAGNEIKDTYTKLSEQVVFGQLTPAQAAVELRKQAEAILAKYKK
jgi:hypothetical protein